MVTPEQRPTRPSRQARWLKLGAPGITACNVDYDDDDAFAERQFVGQAGNVFCILASCS